MYYLLSRRSPEWSWGGERGSLPAEGSERPADPQRQPAPSPNPWTPTESCFWDRGKSSESDTHFNRMMFSDSWNYSTPAVPQASERTPEKLPNQPHDTSLQYKGHTESRVMLRVYSNTQSMISSQNCTWAKYQRWVWKLQWIENGSLHLLDNLLWDSILMKPRYLNNNDTYSNPEIWKLENHITGD